MLIRAGWFYVIQVLPDIAPRRIKFGFATNAHARLLSHRCTCPQARLLVKYPCLSTDEQHTIASVTTGVDTRLSTELYEVHDTAATLARLERLFSWIDWVDLERYDQMLSKAATRPLAADYLADIRDPESTLRQQMHATVW